MKRQTLYIALFAAFTALTGCGGGSALEPGPLNDEGITRGSTDPHSLLGNPDNALVDANNHSKYFSKKTQYHLSYNDNQRIANWVSWHLDNRDLGSVSRTDAFAPDTSLPASFVKLTTNDYTGTGHDRGHQCPSGDRTDSVANNQSTFLMTNMSPQQHGLNSGPWELLETETRNQISAGKECYVISGPGFNSTTHTTVGSKKIHVPSWCWKIVLILPKASGDDLTRITTGTRVIAVKMPNTASTYGHQWREYRVSPATIEVATGLKFFTALPAATADILRTKIDKN